MALSLRTLAVNFLPVIFQKKILSLGILTKKPKLLFFGGHLEPLWAYFDPFSPFWEQVQMKNWNLSENLKFM